MSEEKWIPCDEIFPNVGVPVFILTAADDATVVAVRGKGDLWVWEAASQNISPTAVTHWRPIPGGELDWLLSVIGASQPPSR